MQAKGVCRKKQESVKALFGRSDTSKRSEARPMTLNHGYKYEPSSPIDVPPPMTPPAYRDPHFPAIEDNHFEILDSKTINSLLTIAFCGVRRGNSNRLWSFCQGTPSCMIERLSAKVDMGTTNDRFKCLFQIFSMLLWALSSRRFSIISKVFLKNCSSCFWKPATMHLHGNHP